MRFPESRRRTRPAGRLVGRIAPSLRWWWVGGHRWAQVRSAVLHSGTCAGRCGEVGGLVGLLEFAAGGIRPHDLAAAAEQGRDEPDKAAYRLHI